MNPAVQAVNLGAVAGGLSLWGLFWQASPVVKLIILGLVAASVWVWAIVFEKVTSIRRANRAADAFEDRFWSGCSLDELYEQEGEQPAHPIAAVFGAGMAEWQRSTRGATAFAAASQQRIERAMAITIQREMERLERWMVFLASIGSTATFIGLFGTVWGIMTSFSAIAAMHNTNLAVVAPGISEALFATAMGLVAAVPAVNAYNKFSSDLTRLAGRLESFAGEFGAILSRQTEERA